VTVLEEVLRVLRRGPVWLRVLLAGGVRERGMVLEREVWCTVVCWRCVWVCQAGECEGGIRGCESEEVRVSEACASPVGVRVPDPPSFMGVRQGPSQGRFTNGRRDTDILHHVAEGCPTLTSRAVKHDGVCSKHTRSMRAIKQSMSLWSIKGSVSTMVVALH